MKKIIVLLFLLSSVQLFSQTDTKAKNILDKTSEKTRSYQSIKATFEFNMRNEESGLNETSNGTLILQKDNYKLSFNGVEIYCDGKTLWTYMKEAQEVNIANAGADEETINPATIFTIYEKGYKNSYIGESSIGAKKTYKIELLPLQPKDFSKVILEIEQSTYQIQNAKLFGKDNNIYTIKLLTIETNNSFDASTFTFDTKKNPKVGVNDMR
ncbi:MAG TPA: outer membrane lipoprotein carrier protein LolA [Prolixibacteraceae bacterium]|nr:outer membrane lipoprotein carrier protein LolA [Prolixibacteraceae bacterium]HPS12691.1 outer membrane lipoprotein carrier protein LolA [Prolixibacteraceae bacterium]